MSFKKTLEDISKRKKKSLKALFYQRERERKKKSLSGNSGSGAKMRDGIIPPTGIIHSVFPRGPFHVNVRPSP